MYYLPQEIETWYIIPAIRNLISCSLIKEYDLSYDEVGKILGITRAAVCQYSKGKRAYKLKFPKEINPKILNSCKVLVKDETKAVEEINKILDYIRTQEIKFSINGKLKGATLDGSQGVKFKDGNYRSA